MLSYNELLKPGERRLYSMLKHIYLYTCMSVLCKQDMIVSELYSICAGRGILSSFDEAKLHLSPVALYAELPSA